MAISGASEFLDQLNGLKDVAANAALTDVQKYQAAADALYLDPTVQTKGILAGDRHIAVPQAVLDGDLPEHCGADPDRRLGRLDHLARLSSGDSDCR